MTERRPWTTEQDQILRKLYETHGINKWSEISRIMEQQYHVEGRNGKQCRQRYHNHLKGGIRKEKWTSEEERRLVDLHAEHGNRWAFISKLIEGRTQNCVKNMLYSKMRKSVRLLNRLTYQHFKRQLKQIKISFINRLIEITQNAYKKQEISRSAQEITAINIKNCILRLDIQDDSKLNEQETLKVRTLVQEIHSFNRANLKYQRGVALAKLKKQKMKRKDSQFSLEQQDEFCAIVDDIHSVPKKKVTRRNKETQEPSVENQALKASSIMKVQDAIELPSAKGQKNNLCTLGQAGSITPACLIDRVDLRNKVTVTRTNSHEIEFLNLLEDAGLDLPIQVDECMRFIGTPGYHNRLDWCDAASEWKGSYF